LDAIGPNLEHESNPGAQYLDRQVQNERGQIEVLSDGAYISSWKVKNEQGEDVEMLYRGTGPKRVGIPLLFPYYGDGEPGQPSHGIGRISPWAAEVDGNTVSATLSSTQLDEETAAKYPHPFEATQLAELGEDGSLLLTLRILNTGTEPAPAGPGWHPLLLLPEGFARDDVQIQGIEGYQSPQDWDNNPPDDEYPHDGALPVSIIMSDRTITMQDESQPLQVRYAVVWSEASEDPNHDFLSVEPVSSVNYAEDPARPSDRIWIEPDATFEMKVRFTAEFTEPSAA
jgi:galactose mutarotase-like enzyme